MFYIGTNILRKREALMLRLLPALIVFFAFVGVTIMSWTAARKSVRDEQYAILRQQNNDVVDSITQRMSAYEDILRGGVALFQASEQVTREEWQHYFESFAIEERYPGIHGVGYTVMLEPEDKAAHEAEIRSQGYPDYRIRPDTARDKYSSIVYIEPLSRSNQEAIGFDMYSEPTRRAAMDKARQTGAPALSGVVRLVQENVETTEQPGFLMYVPLYSTKSIPPTEDARAASLHGYVYAPFRAHDFVNQSIHNILPHYEFEIVNLDPDGREHLYASKNYTSMVKQPDAQGQVRTIQLAGATWEVHGIATPQVVNSSTRARLASILGGGLLLSLLIASFLYMVLTNRSNALARKEERTVQDAKEELLALASHQLRTPATGVKQYIGILREGFAGKLSSEQRKMLDKAYESNERQLATINDMLVVARADASQLKIYPKSIILNELVRSIMDERTNIIFARNQTLKTDIPTKPLRIKADKQYLRMAIENIISNASKYTKSGGQISIKLKENGSYVLIVIRDSGVGVARKDYPLLFKKFSRIPNELTDQVVGSGIGLYLAKKIVELHDGKIEFNSADIRGSVVTISLPKDK